MLYQNNKAIDTSILSDRIRMELASRRAGHERDGSRMVPKLLLPTAVAGASMDTTGPRRLRMRIAGRIKSVPIVGEIAAWAVWILRARRIARAAFTTEAELAETRNQVAGIDARVSSIDARLVNQVSSIDARLVNQVSSIDARLGNQVASIDARLRSLERTLQDLRESFEVASRDAGEQTAAIRREVMFQQRRLLRLSETMGKESTSGGEVAAVMRNERLDSFYEAFEGQYRGSHTDIKQRLAPYLDRLQLTGAGQKETPIVDIGCGRGEWLELLQENGLAAYGIDVNSMMVQRTVSLALDARVADLSAHLRSLGDCSRSAITAFHVVEHLPFDVLIDFIDEALRVLLPGGMLILETPNPENMRVGATTFYNDPTHRNPIPPEPLRFIVEHRGFSDVEILRLHPSPESERLKGEGWDIAHLNALLFGPRDYAIIARRL